MISCIIIVSTSNKGSAVICYAIKKGENMLNFFKKKEKENTKIINMKDIPMTDDGEPDVAAILAANGLSDIDLSKAKIYKKDKDSEK